MSNRLTTTIGMMRDAVLVVLGIAVALAVVAGAVGAVWGLNWSHRRSILVVEVRNGSPHLIDEVATDVCGHRLHASNIAPGGAVALRFRIRCEAGYAVEIQLGTSVMRPYGGLVTNGLHGRDVFTVTAADTVRHERLTLSDAEIAAANGDVAKGGAD